MTIQEFLADLLRLALMVGGLYVVFCAVCALIVTIGIAWIHCPQGIIRDQIERWRKKHGKDR